MTALLKSIVSIPLLVVMVMVLMAGLIISVLVFGESESPDWMDRPIAAAGRVLGWMRG